jgi:hypothetical protein
VPFFVELPDERPPPSEKTSGVILTNPSERSAEDPFGAFIEWDSDADRKAYAKL